MKHITEVRVTEQPDKYGDSDADLWHLDVRHEDSDRFVRVMTSRAPEPVNAAARALAKAANYFNPHPSAAFPAVRVTRRTRK